jgi:hypothetical protein
LHPVGCAPAAGATGKAVGSAEPNWLICGEQVIVGMKRLPDSEAETGERAGNYSPANNIHPVVIIDNKGQGPSQHQPRHPAQHCVLGDDQEGFPRLGLRCAERQEE